MNTRPKVVLVGIDLPGLVTHMQEAVRRAQRGAGGPEKLEEMLDALERLPEWQQRRFDHQSITAQSVRHVIRLAARTRAPKMPARSWARAGLGVRTSSGARKTKSATTSGSRDDGGGEPDPPDPPSPAPPQRRDDEQDRGTGGRPRRTRGDLTHAHVLVLEEFERLARIAYSRAWRARVRAWWRRLARWPIGARRLAVMR